MKANTIKRARAKRGHTMTEAAASVGVGERTWQNWETSGAKPRSPAIRDALARYVEESKS